MDTAAQPQQYSDLAVIFVLLYTVISVVALSVFFAKKSKRHLIWTLTLGWLLAFVAGFLLVDLFNAGWLGAIASIILSLLSFGAWLTWFGYQAPDSPRLRNHTQQSHTQSEIERLRRLGAPHRQAESITPPRFPTTPPPLSPAQRKKIKRQRNPNTAHARPLCAQRHASCLYLHQQQGHHQIAPCPNHQNRQHLSARHRFGHPPNAHLFAQQNPPPRSNGHQHRRNNQKFIAATTKAA